MAPGSSSNVVKLTVSQDGSVLPDRTENGKRVAVVGAGTSGLMAMKSLKEESFHPICFEKTSRLGGLWHFHEDDTKGVPSVMWSTSLNNGKEVGAISDFPALPDDPNYMRHFKVLDMFLRYAKKFDLLRHIRYNKEVIKVERAADYDKTGRWNVVVKDTMTQEITEDIYDGVMVCIGHLSLPNIPEFPQMSTFQGEILHTHSIKKFMNYENKKVCVIGTGSSALDAAVEISHRADQVYLSIRTPTWIFTRQGPYGYPLDWTLFTWDHLFLQKFVPESWVDKCVQEVFINPRFSHTLYNILPKHGASGRDPAVNDGIWNRLMNGAILLKKDIKYFTKNGIVFCDDGDQEVKVNTVVLGTGYDYDFPFLDRKDFVKDGNKIHLYKCVYPPHLPHPTLGIIGFIVPMGPGFPCVEMQCRWFANVLSGKSKLPTKDKMMRDINRQYHLNLKRYRDSPRVFIHVDFGAYLEDLASKFGANPSMLKMLLTDFELFSACAIGPYVPYRFRLVGPHKWQGARNAILKAGQRMRAPLQGKKALEKAVKKKSSMLKYIALCLAGLLWYLKHKNYLNYELLMKMLAIAQRCYIMAQSMLSNFLLTGKFCYQQLNR